MGSLGLQEAVRHLQASVKPALAAFALNWMGASAFVTCSRTAMGSPLGITPTAPSRWKYSASFSPNIPFKIKTGGQVPRKLICDQWHRSTRLIAHTPRSLTGYGQCLHTGSLQKTCPRLCRCWKAACNEPCFGDQLAITWSEWSRAIATNGNRFT